MISRQIRKLLCVGTMLSGFAAPAMAQDPGTTAPPAASTDDIIVTAQRREERLVDVPISITAVNAAKLESSGVTSMTDLDRVVPGLVFYTTASHAAPTIRGVGSTLTGPGADNPVAIYIDGVYQSAASGSLFDLNNIQQIEVLKGPQGTLFGRNATGGAIRVTTLQPGNQPELRATLSYGRFNDFQAKIYANGPIVEDVLAFNIAGFFRRDDAYITNLYYNEKIQGARSVTVNAKLRWTPGPDTSFTLGGTYVDQRDDKFESFGPYRRRTAAYSTPAGLAFTLPGRNEINQDIKGIWHIWTKAVSFRAEQNTSIGTLSAITGYTDYLGDPLRFDPEQSPAMTGYLESRDEARTFSQEVNFASEPWNGISLTAGTFYYRDDARRIQPFRNAAGVIIAGYQARILTHAYAAYAELNFDATDQLHFIGGMRYSYEKKRFNFRNIVSNATGQDRAHWDAWTPRAVVRFEPTPSSNIYASFSKGFKSGVFNPSIIPSANNRAVRPENVTAYEVGYKTSANGLRFSASAFYNTYKDIQVNIQLSPGNLAYQNAGKAEIYGAEAEIGFRLSDELELTAGGAYTHGRYTEFPNGPISDGSNNPVRYGDVSGNVTQRTPEFTGNIGLTYNRRTDSGTLGANINGAYNSGYFPAPDNRLATPKYFVVNGEVSWTTADDRYRFALWGRNLTNATKLLYLAAAQLDVAIYDAPITYGASLTLHFK